MSLLHAGVKSHTSLLHRRMAVGTLPDSMDRHDVTISCPAQTVQPPPAAPTPSFTGCFGLPYHDHNYGMPPPATPPTSPNVPETVPQSVPQPLPQTPLPPTRINGHIDIEDISVTTEVTTTPEVSEDAVAVTTDDSVTRCICDFQHDDGYMICCDRCSVWQHVDCMGVDRDNIPENYLCELCEPRKCDKQHAIQIQTRKRQELAALGILPIVDSSATETEDETVRLGINPPTPKRTQKRKKKKDRDKATKVVRKVKVKKDRDGKLKLKKEKVNGGKVVNSVLTQSPPKRKVLNVKKKAANRKANKASAMGFTISNEDARDGWDSPDSDGYEDAKTNQYSVDIQNMLATHKFNGVRTTAASRPCEQLLAQLWKVINIDGVQKGLEAAEDVACDMPVIEYKGKVLLRDQYDRETLFFNKPQPFTLFYSKFENMELCIDASSFGNEARFVRRSCTPNAEVRHLADSTSMRFYIYAQQDIVKGDEVTIPFDSNYKDSSREVECACGKPTCLVAKIHHKEEAHPARRKKKRLSSRSISGSEHEPGEVVPIPQLQLQPQPHPQPLSPVAAPVSPRKVSPPVAAPATKRRKTSGHRASFSEDTPPVVLEPLILASPPPPALPNSPPPPPPPASRTTRSAYQQQLQKEQKAHDKEIKVEVGASPPAKHHRKERIASPRRLSTSSLSPKSHPTPKLDVVKVEDIKTEPTHFDDGATDEGVSPHCNTGTEHDSSEDTEKHKKMTREERKMEAIMKAFEKLEKREERRKEALARLQEHGKKPPSTPTTPAAGVKDDITSPIKEEIKEEPKPEIKPADIRPKVNKTKKKKTGTPLRRRSRMNSSASGTSSAADVHSSADESSNLSAPAASTPTTADSSAPNSTATTPLTAGPQARAFRFPKTKKHLMNEWFSEKGLAEVAKPLSIKTESLDEPATPKDSVEFMQCVPSPHTNSMSHLRRSSISGCSQVKVAATSAACTASSQRTSGDCSMGSAKKRWLRQAMFESTGQPSNGQSPGGSMSPVHSGAMSPNPNFSSTFSMNSPGQSSSSVDFVTPLKKRRMARESICLDIPPAPSTSTNAQDGGTASEGTASEGEKSDTESAPNNTSGPSADDIINYVPPNGIKAHLPIPPLGTSNNLFERLGFKSAKSPGDSGPMKQEGNEGCVSESLLSPTRGWARDEPDGTMMVTSSPDAVSLAVMNRSSQALLVNASSASVHAAVCSLSAMSSPRASSTISSTLLGGSPHSSPSRSAGSIPYVSPLLDPTLHSSPRRLSDSSRQWLYNSSDTNILDLTRTLDAKTAIVCDSNIDTESDSVRRSTSSTLPGRQAMDTSSLCASDAKISNALDIVGHPESTSDHNHRTLQPPVSSSGSTCSRISQTSQLSSPRSCTSSNSRTLPAISGDNSHYTSTCADSHITNHNSNNNAAVAGTSAMSQEVCSSVKQSCSDSEDSGVRLEADASVMDGVGSTLRVDSDDSLQEDVGSWCSPANSNQPSSKSSREHSTGKHSHSPSSENSDHDSGVQGVSASTLSGDPDARTTTPDSRSSSSHSNENNTLICIDDNEVHTTQSLPKQSTSAEAASHSIDRVECSNADNSCPESAEHVRTSQVYSVQDNSEGVLRVRHASNTSKQEVSVGEVEVPSGSVEVDRSEDDESSKPVLPTQGEERESEVAKQGSDCEQSIAPSGSKSPAVNVADEPRPSGSSDCSAVSKEAIISAAVSSEMVSNSDNIETSQASSAAVGGSEAGPVSGSESADGENEAGGRRCRTESVSDTQIDSNHDSSAMDISMEVEGPVCSNSMERQESAAVAEDVGRSLEEGEIGESDESMEVEPSVSSSNTTAVIGAKTQHSSPGLANSATSTSSPTTVQRRADSLSPGSSVARTPSLTPPHCSGLSSSDNAVSCSSEIIDAPQQPSLGEDGEVHSSDLRSGLDHVSAANDMESNREEEMEEGEISDSEPEEPMAGAEAEAEASRPSLDFGPRPSVSQSQPSDALVTSQEHVSFSNSTAVNNSQANVEVTSHSDGVSSPEVVAESSETVNAVAPEVDPISSSSNDVRTQTGVENNCVSASSSSVGVSLHSLQLTGSSHESGISSSSSNGRQAFSDTNSRPSADSSTTETHITSSSQIACSETNASLHPQPSEDSEPSGSVSSDSEVGQSRGCADSELRMVESSTWGLSSSCSGTDAVTASSAQGNFQNCSSSSSSISSNSSLLGDSNVVPISSSSSSSSPNKSSLFSHCTNSSSHFPTTSTPATPPAKKKVSLLEYRQRMRKRTVGPSSSSRGDATTPPVSSSEAAHSLTPRSTPSPRSTTPTLATLPLFESISSSSSDHRHRGSVSPLPSRRDRKDDSDVRWGSPGSSSDWNREPTTPQPTLSLTERLRREFGVDASESEEEDVKERHWSGGSPPPPPPPPPPPSHSSDISAVHSSGFLPSSSMGSLPVPMLNSRPKPGPSVHMPSGSYGHVGSHHSAHHPSSSHMPNPSHPHSLTAPVSNVPSRVSHSASQPPLPIGTDPRQSRERPLPPPPAGANSTMMGPSNSGQQPLLRGGAQRGGIPSLMSLPSFPAKPYGNNSMVGNSHPASGVSGTASSSSSSYIQLAQASSSSGYNSQVSHPPTGSNQPSPVAYNQPMPSHPNYNQPGIFNQAKASSTSGYNQLPSSSFNSPTPGAGFNQTGLPGAMNRVGFSASGPPQPPVNTNFPVQHNSMPSSHMPHPMPPSLPPPPPPPPPHNQSHGMAAPSSSTLPSSSSHLSHHGAAPTPHHSQQWPAPSSHMNAPHSSHPAPSSSSSQQQSPSVNNFIYDYNHKPYTQSQSNYRSKRS